MQCSEDASDLHPKTKHPVNVTAQAAQQKSLADTFLLQTARDPRKKKECQVCGESEKSWGSRIEPAGATSN